MRRWRLWIALVLGLLATIVALQNTEPATTDILWMTVEMPRVLLLLGTALVGFLLGLFTADRLHRRARKPAEQAEPTPP